MIDTSLGSHNPLRFRKNLVQGIEKLIMTINDETRGEKI